ncbi:MAG: amidase [Gammaproteobacteria bacterium]|jgi:amidase
MTDLFELTACEAVERLKSGDISPLELLDASQARVDACEPHINALPTLCFDRAREHAERISRGDAPTGVLHGLPVAIKDLNPVAGVRTTYGSPIYSDHIAARSDVLVERIESEGGVVVAKANTPEFGAGASTFNEVLGLTRNPWNVTKSAAGSSGGSAAAVASGEVWLAQGSDLGGSLRIPGSFNSVVGLRPSVGRVPRGQRHPFGVLPFDSLYVEGPLGRTVDDVALFLDALAGEHPEEPYSFPPPAQSYLAQARERTRPRRVAWSGDLGITPVDPDVLTVCRAAVQQFETSGTRVEAFTPDFTGAVDSFQVLRASFFAAEHQGHLREHRDLLKPEIIWNIEKGLELTAAQIGDAEMSRARICQSLNSLFETYDLLVCPTAIVAPFDAEVRYIDQCAGVTFDNYIHWLVLTFAVTLTGCPSVSLPAGFTAEGLPVGLQLIAPHRCEGSLLAMAGCLEDELGIRGQLPVTPRGADGKALF